MAYVGLENVTGGTGEIVLNAAAEAAASGTAFVFDARHVLYGKLRPYLNKVAEPDFVGRCSTELIPLLPARNVDRTFLASLLRHPRVVAEVTGRNTGSRMPRADLRVLFDLPVPLPPLDEQRRIVDLLNRAAGIRRLREAALAKARDTIPALFLSMFGDPTTNPMGWSVVRLGEVIADGPKNGLYRPATDYGTGTAILRIDSFDAGEIHSLGALKRLRLDPPIAQQFALAPGDIVINRVNSPPQLGKSAMVPVLNEPVVFESNMMRVRLDALRMLPEVLITMLQLPSVQRALTRNAKHAINQSSINQGDVKGLSIILPPSITQAVFAERLADLRSIITQQGHALAVARDTERALMARLLG